MTMVDRLTASDAGTILEGSALRTDAELSVAVMRYAFEKGMPVVDKALPNPSMYEFDTADKSAVDESDEAAIEWFQEDLNVLADTAREWLNEHVAPNGFEFDWDDGLILRSHGEEIL
jgi:hypothetical protein